MRSQGDEGMDAGRRMMMWVNGWKAGVGEDERRRAQRRIGKGLEDSSG